MSERELIRTAVAYHEAGHTVSAVVLGCRVTAAWVHGQGGRTVFSTPRNDWDAAVIALSGTIAQLRAVPGSPLTASDDFKIIDACSDRRGCCAEAEAIVDERWDLIRRVAAELLDHGELRLCAAVAERIGLKLSG